MDPTSDQNVTHSNLATSSSHQGSANYEENLTYSWMEKYLREAKVEIDGFLEERRQSDLTHKLAEISLNGGSGFRTCSQESFEDPELACNHLKDCLTNLLTELDVDIMDLDTTDSIVSSPVSPPAEFRDISPMAITSSSESNASTSVSPIISLEKSDTSDSCTTSQSSPCLNHRDTTSFKSVDIELIHGPMSNSLSSNTSLTKYNQQESPVSAFISNYHRNSYYDNNDEISVNLLTASQIQKIIDFHIPAGEPNRGASVSRVSSVNSVFGCEIDVIEKNNGGLTLPPFIENALIYLVRYGISSVGIFRKSGVKARITALRLKLEELTSCGKALSLSNFSNGSLLPGDEYCVYDIADMVKSWLRELKPKPLISNEIIQAFKSCAKLENLNFNLAIRLISLLSDAQRDVLQIVLQFLSWFSTNSNVNQMNSHNLAICLTPSLCECISTHIPDANNAVDPHGIETEFLYDAQKCLEYLIDHCESMSVVSLNAVPFNPNNEYSQKNTTTKDSSPSIANDLPPKHTSTIVINASPVDIFRRILYQRNLFDPMIVEWSIVEENQAENMDVYNFKIQSSVFLPVKTFTVQRRWRFITADTLGSSREGNTGDYINAIVLEETGTLYESSWNISVLGEGKSVVQHTIALDLRGHSYEWYKKSFPDIHDWQLCNLNQSFLVDFIEAKEIKSSKV